MAIKQEGFNFIYYVSCSVIVLAVFLGAWLCVEVLLLAFAGVLFAIFLRSINNILKKLVSMPDSVSITLVLVFFLLLFILAIVFIVPIINEQIAKLIQEIPGAWQSLLNFFSEFLNLKPILSLYAKIDIENLFGTDVGILAHATNLLSTTFGFFGSIFVLSFIGIFLAYSPDTYEQGFLKLIPQSQQEKVQDILVLAATNLRWWMIGKFLAMSIVGISTAVGLWLLDIPLAFTLGLFAAILSFIPNIGPVISVIPAIFIAIIQSPISVVYVIILFVVIQLCESYVITPLIMKKAISEPPALIISMQLIMAILTGALGLALAAPILVVLTVVIEKMYIEKK